MNLSSLIKITKRGKKRVGRGIGSGKGGHTSGKGNKGQKARTGVNIPSFFEGGQVPIIKRLPQKRGKGNSPTRMPKQIVNLSIFSKFKSGDSVTPKLLGLGSAKVLNKGDIPAGLTLMGFSYSKKALEKIKTAGSFVK